MRIRLNQLIPTPDGDFLAQIETPVGAALVRWCGEPDAVVGGYDVEWTIDERIEWGRNAWVVGPGGAYLAAAGDRVVMCGELALTDDGALTFDLAGALILLDGQAPVESSRRVWTELSVHRENVLIFPYEL